MAREEKKNSPFLREGEWYIIPPTSKVIKRFLKYNRNDINLFYTDAPLMGQFIQICYILGCKHTKPQIIYRTLRDGWGTADSYLFDDAVWTTPPKGSEALSMPNMFKG